MQHFQKNISLVRISILVALLGLLTTAMPAHADLSLNTLGDATLIDFQDYTGAGLQPGGAAGTLDSDNWTMYLNSDSENESTGFGDTVGSGVLGRGQSPGGVNLQGIYAFDTGGGNIALGTELDGSSDFSNTGVRLLITNNTGATVDYLRVSYEFWYLNNGVNVTENEIEFLDGSNFYDPNLLKSPEKPIIGLFWEKIDEVVDLYLPVTNFGGTISAMANGESMEILWQFTGVGPSSDGSYDEAAIDNIRITPFSSTVPEPSTLLLGALAGVGLLTPRRRRKS